MDAFILRLLLSFVVGGIWITLATILAERLGTRVGGVIAGLPSTAVVAFSFIAWTQGVEKLFDVLTVFPLTFSANGVYLVVYALLVRWGTLAGVGGALLAWGLLETGIVLIRVNDFALALAVWAAALILCYYILEHKLRIRPQERIAIRYTIGQILWRGAFAGAMVAVAVIMSRFGGPIAGSVFSSFPALFTSTLIIAMRSAGPRFARALTTPLLVSSEVNLAVFAVALRHAILDLALIPAILLAYGLSAVTAFLTYRFLKARSSQPQKAASR